MQAGSTSDYEKMITRPVPIQVPYHLMATYSTVGMYIVLVVLLLFPSPAVEKQKQSHMTITRYIHQTTLELNIHVVSTSPLFLVPQ